MKPALALALALSAAPAAAAPAPTVYEELPPGRYALDISGLVTTVCARAVAAEFGRLPEVEKAGVDFEQERAVILVRLDSTLRVDDLRKALRRAEKLARLGGYYELGDVAYKP